MNTIILDTHECVTRLKSCGFTEAQAEGQTKVLTEIMEKHLASKAEMDERENVLKRDIAQTHADLKQDIERVRSEIKEAELNTIKWMIGLLVAQSGLIIGVMMKLMHP